MNTLKLQPSIDETSIEAPEKNYTISNRLRAFIESQKDKRLAWFMISLLAQAVLILPIPPALIYYYNASESVLAVTLTLFFANIIAGMGGSKTSVLISLVALNVVAHVVMILTFILR
ncbi:MAG TPA: hypothetical protein VIM89_11460 [Mucilaginibacter sp.]